MTAPGRAVTDWTHRAFAGMAGDALHRVDGLMWSAEESLGNGDGVDALANAVVAWHHVTLATAIAARLNDGPIADRRGTTADEYRRRVFDKIVEITAEHPTDDPDVAVIVREWGKEFEHDDE